MVHEYPFEVRPAIIRAGAASPWRRFMTETWRHEAETCDRFENGSETISD
jgi:hypothetical protein